MATAVETTKRTLEGEQRIVIRNVGWEGYESLLAMIGDGHGRLTFDGKDVELMSPSQDHEFDKNTLGILILTLAQELKFRCKGGASTTWRKKSLEQGFEADLCYYMENSPKVRGKKGKIDLAGDPPPDLAVEVEISRSALNKLSIYAAFGVPEVWRYDGETLTIEILQADGTYACVPSSPRIPAITPEEVVHWVRFADSFDDDAEFCLQFREWIRQELLPRHQAR